MSGYPRTTEYEAFEKTVDAYMGLQSKAYKYAVSFDERHAIPHLEQRFITMEWQITPSSTPEEIAKQIQFEVSAEQSRFFSAGGDKPFNVKSDTSKLAPPAGPIILTKVCVTNISNTTSFPWEMRADYLPSCPYIPQIGKPYALSIPIGNYDRCSCIHDLHPDVEDTVDKCYDEIVDAINFDPLLPLLSPMALKFLTYKSTDESYTTFFMPECVFGHMLTAYDTKFKNAAQPYFGGKNIKYFALSQADYDGYIANFGKFLKVINMCTVDFTSSADSFVNRKGRFDKVINGLPIASFTKNLCTTITPQMPPNSDKPFDAANPSQALTDAIRKRVVGCGGNKSDAVGVAMQYPLNVSICVEFEYICPKYI